MAMVPMEDTNSNASTPQHISRNIGNRNIVNIRTERCMEASASVVCANIHEFVLHNSHAVPGLYYEFQLQATRGNLLGKGQISASETRVA